MVRNIPALAIIACATLVVLLVLSKADGGQGNSASSVFQNPTLQQNKISISISPKIPRGGNAVDVNVESIGCDGALKLYLDGKMISYYNARNGGAASTIIPLAGSHSIRAEKGECNSNAQFVALPAECKDGESRACLNGDGCDGTQGCGGGQWGGCSRNVRICVPGAKASCPLNACASGKMECNSCGTSWGPCLAACPGGTCAAG